MPPAKDYNAKASYGRSLSNNETTMSARVYHPATNLIPPSPPTTPTGSAPMFPNRSQSTSSWSRQNSNSKYS
ncbi:unnamed protein product [Pieris macdunnoughi]|uniref:Uncharacterized protein n=1 Tax=Pieris macdunnoughi TaxID=345717 RepID=A0A821U9A2_9NEOP|nr:unnamed protein product [Pieris macdunnoughi]